MFTVRKLPALTPEQYLELELAADVRHELVAGQLNEMTGASQFHNVIAMAFAANLYAALQAPWRVYMSDMKVRVHDDFYYPDVMISQEPVTVRNHYLVEPIVVIEVLSPATQARDRLEKRLGYQRLASLREYVLVSQDEPSIEIFRRAGNDGWEVETCGAGHALRLTSIGFEAPVGSLYRDLSDATR
jgi:Uma2 family endonuclease